MKASKPDSIIIAIAGGPYAGKKRLCNELLTRLEALSPSTKAHILHLSSFLYPGQTNRYSLDSYDIKAYKEALVAIQCGNERIPLPDGKELCFSPDKDRVVFTEGYYLLLPELLPSYTSKLFVYADGDTRLERSVIRRVCGDHEVLAEVLDDFVQNAKPAYEMSIHPTRENADIILPQRADIQSALLFVIQHLQDLLEELNQPKLISSVHYDPLHEKYMKLAHEMAETSLANREVPVGCVFVYKGEVIGRGYNQTNCSLSGIRHAEIIAIEEILEKYPSSVFSETTLYVTVEPCLMCAAALKQLHIEAVYFGCGNDRFGGCGSVFSINKDPSIDPKYPAYPGLFRPEAVMLMRRFYVQENAKAPVPQAKKQRVLKHNIEQMDITRYV
ncbi:tRNA specific adenosine deaminase subunit Tad2 [Schizosaccharomyces octosporus yFS286]|uniref:tRNA(adenine(34)) deaminase n=1 Tax=Schizosaccharomyces octosporus (strain yFS286) TaxID=483514 RepID=S9PSY6_SCHOY|nr:tRNA specific adenosine deaminase subunit Tad2 [Schizosaccharomyces octosporus yFS286]EPX71072.1 tRNA specific adenosine deaminase subunit Tad2 [Schizosaccharomyces octosporus yFS286]